MTGTDDTLSTPAATGLPARVPRSALLASPWNFFALGGGSGLAPKAPGTVGTLLGIPVLLLMPTSPLAYALVTLLLFGFGIVACDRCARDLGVHDHPAIVWDEIVGYLVTMFMVPHTLSMLVLGFFAFRVFDILKPWPIGLIDRRVHGGVGIMADDVVAGVIAALLIQLLLRVIG